MTLNDASRESADRRLAHAGAEQREVGVGAAVERQVDDLLVADDLAAVARIGLEQPRRAGRPRPSRRCRRPSCVRSTRWRALTVTATFSAIGGREALQLGADAVGADADVEELVVAVRVGDRGRDDAGVGVLRA